MPDESRQKDASTNRQDTSCQKEMLDAALKGDVPADQTLEPLFDHLERNK